MSLSTPAPDQKTIVRRAEIAAALRVIAPGDSAIDGMGNPRLYKSDGFTIYRQSPLLERMIRGLLTAVLPYARRFRFARQPVRLLQRAVPLAKRIARLQPLGAMLVLAPNRLPTLPTATGSQTTDPIGRVALLQGHAGRVQRPSFRDATVRVLNRTIFDVVVATESIGGALQIGLRSRTPVVHRIELLDWATGRRAPLAMNGLDEEDKK